jgi:hypothetical protein
MRRALQGQATDRAPKVLTPIQQVVPRIWLELSQPAQQQLAQLMARLLLRMRQPRVCPFKEELDADGND